MPQILLKTYNNEVSLLVWQIQESEKEILGLLPASVLLDENLSKITIEHLRLEFLVGRLCVQELCKTLNIQFKSVKKDEHGKPFMEGSDWEMSLTHSKNFIAVAVHPKKPIGVDIEKPSEKLKKIMPRLFSVDENKQVEDDLIKMSWFWSAKEALYKLYGKRGIDFKENLFLQLTSDDFTGKIILENYETNHIFTVEAIFDYFLVIAI